MNVALSENKLRKLIREEVKTVLRKEILKLRLAAMPDISDQEQKEIEKSYGKPSRDIGKILEMNEGI